MASFVAVEEAQGKLAELFDDAPRGGRAKLVRGSLLSPTEPARRGRTFAPA